MADLTVFEAVDPSLTISAAGMRGVPVFITDWPYGTDDNFVQRRIRQNFSNFIAERAPVVDQLNAITNPSFEKDLQGWTLSGTGVDYEFERYEIPDLEDEYWFEGAYAAHIDAMFPFYTGATLTISSPMWDVLPGQRWSARLTVDLRNTVASNSFRMQWLTSSGVHVDYTPAQTWTTEGVTFRAQDSQMVPAGAAKGRIQLTADALEGFAYSYEAYIDAAAAILWTGSSPNYFDGDTAGSYAWAGEPHASASIQWH